MNISESLSEVKNFIDGKFEKNRQKSLTIINPQNGNTISSIPLSTYTDVDRAVQAAKKAFPAWSGITFKERVQIFFTYRSLVEKKI